MANYKGRRKGTRRIVIWAKNRRHEWIIAGTKADGDSFEARKRVELDADQLSRRVAPRFSEFCARHYAPYAETNLKRSTWHNVRIYQVATLVEFFGEAKLTEVSTERIEAFKRARNKKIGATSLNNELRVLRTVLNYAEALGYPVVRSKIKKLKPDKNPRVRVWTLDELQRLFAATRELKPWLLRMFVFLANTGCRRGEAIAAEWSWVDLPGSMIRIPSNEVWTAKSGKPREIPMSDAARTVLDVPHESERWVFPRLDGSRYTDFPKDLFAEIKERAKITGGAHTLRHTFASRFLAKEPDLFLLGQVLGHSHQRVTELYTHLLPDHLSRARNAVNLAPALQTVATTVAEPAKGPKRPRKTATRP